MHRLTRELYGRTIRGVKEAGWGGGRRCGKKEIIYMKNCKSKENA